MVKQYSAEFKLEAAKMVVASTSAFVITVR